VNAGDILNGLSCLTIPGAIVGGLLWLGSGSKGGVYVWRTRKPHAILGLPVIGRHVAYVGQTKSFAHRERQHLGRPIANDPYARTGAAWCDLSPRCYRIPLPTWRWLLLLVEALLITVLMPVYNVKLNKHNPRRITAFRALQMRAQRDRNAMRPSVLRYVAMMIGAIRWYHAVGSIALVAVGIGWIS
jgi:hypothetical protein